MKKIIFFLMISGILMLNGCTAHDDELLAKINELEQRISQLEQQLEPLDATPDAMTQAAETPVPAESDINSETPGILECLCKLTSRH